MSQMARGTKGVSRRLQNARVLARCLLVLTGIIINSCWCCCSSQTLLGFSTRGYSGGGVRLFFSRAHPAGPRPAVTVALIGKPAAQLWKSNCGLQTPPSSNSLAAKKSILMQTPPWGKHPAAKSCLAWSKSPAAINDRTHHYPHHQQHHHHHHQAKQLCSAPGWRCGSRNPMGCFGDGNVLQVPANPHFSQQRERRTRQRLAPAVMVPRARSHRRHHHHRRRHRSHRSHRLRRSCRQANVPPDANNGGGDKQPPVPCTREENASTVTPSTFWVGPRRGPPHDNARSTQQNPGNRRLHHHHHHHHHAGAADSTKDKNALLSRVSKNLVAWVLVVRPRRISDDNLRRDETEKARRRRRRRWRWRKSARTQTRAARARAPRVSGVPAFIWGVCRGLVALEGRCEATWGGRAGAHVVAGGLASSHSLAASAVVGLAVWVSCAKRLAVPIGVCDPRDNHNRDGWKQVARITVEVGVLWYCHALPHGLGVGRPLRGNYGSGKAGDLVGAMWHFFGQGAFVRLIAASGRLVGINVLEANGLLLALSCLGNGVAGSRMRLVAEAVGADTYQLRGFFSRTTATFRKKPILSLPFDMADTFLALQGILSATERELVRKNGTLASAFLDYAAQSTNTLDAHSLGALGARNLMGMGIVRARVRMFGRPVLSLGWTEKANNMCMVGDPICGSLLQKILDPTCVILKGKGHLYDAYLACVGC